MFNLNLLVEQITEEVTNRELQLQIAKLLSVGGTRNSIKISDALNKLTKSGILTRAGIKKASVDLLTKGTGWHVAGTYLNRNRTLFERVTPVVFHFTYINNALKILKSGTFALTPDHGTEGERSLGEKDRPFYLSTTRSAAQGSYHEWQRSGVLFALDGDWFNDRGYTGRPINYWSPFGSVGKDEMEDRIYHDEPYLPIDAITEAHILVDTKEPHPREKVDLRQLLILLKKRGIPTYLYTDLRAWQLKNPNKRTEVAKVDLKGHIYGMDRGKQYAWYYPDSDTKVRQARRRGIEAGYTDNYGQFRPERASLLYRYLELYHKKATPELTKGAQSLASDIAYDRYRGDTERSLAAEFHNNRGAGKEGRKYYDALAAIMKREGWRTPSDLITGLSVKWKAIKDTENA